ncbi:MAG: hypothetical protein AAF961_16940, partial [Planctomycetota bacterium]
HFGHILRAATVSPDGKRVAIGGMATTVTIWNAEDDALAELDAGSEVFDLTWCEDGRLAAALFSGEIVIWNADGERLLTIRNAHEGNVVCLDWKPGGRVLASTGADLLLKTWDPASGELQWQAETQRSFAREICFSRDGSMLATAHSDGLTLWDSDTSQIRHKLDSIRQDFKSVDWSPDGRRVVSGSPSSVALWDVPSGKMALRLDCPQDLQTVRWSSDGVQIIASGRGIRVYDATRGYALNQSSE